MQQFSYVIKNIQDLKYKLDDFLTECPMAYKTILVSVYTEAAEDEELKALISAIKSRLPQAIIIGATSSGEIADGIMQLHTTLLNIQVFSSTHLHVKAIDIQHENIDNAGKTYLAECRQHDDLVGTGILATCNNIMLKRFWQYLENLPESVAVFGCGANTSYSTVLPKVFTDKHILKKGLLLVSFYSKNLHIHVTESAGWRPLGKTMKITSMYGSNLIRKLDDLPAVKIYEHYLRIFPNDNFAQSAVSFPMIIERHGRKLARVPMGYSDNGALTFGADFTEGEIVRLGYNDPVEVMNRSCQCYSALQKFQPEAIFLFSGASRRHFLRENTNMELKPYQEIAPTAGFYTNGEIKRTGKHIDLLNAVTVAVGFREGSPVAGEAHKNVINPSLQLDDSLNMVQRLAHFISITSAELEDANHKLDALARQDRLTKLFNRGEVEYTLGRYINDLGVTLKALTIIMLDIDHFKSINDTYGHDMGDIVLQYVADVIRNSVRGLDLCGRWGGEEFMVLLPNADREAAKSIAERMRARMERMDILPDGRKITGSFGVAEYRPGESYQQLYKRLDKALYTAKHQGRNQVVAAEAKSLIPQDH